MACEPVKLNEILATGLGAVGTPLPAFRSRPGLVRIAENAEAFARSIQETLSESPATASEIEAVRATLPSWESIAGKIRCFDPDPMEGVAFGGPPP